MNENKLKKLFAAARKETVPLAPPNFAADVLRAVRREPVARAAVAGSASASVFEPLNFWFPRLAAAAAAVIVLCVAAHLLVSGPEDEAAQLTMDQNLSVEDL